MKNNNYLGVFTPKDEVGKVLFDNAVSTVGDLVNDYANKRTVYILNNVKERVLAFEKDDKKCLNKSDAISDVVDVIDFFIRSLEK